MNDNEALMPEAVAFRRVRAVVVKTLGLSKDATLSDSQVCCAVERICDRAAREVSGISLLARDLE